MLTKDDLLEAAWKCYQAAQRVARARDAVRVAHEHFKTAEKVLQHAQTDHMTAAQRQREIEETLVAQRVVA